MKLINFEKNELLIDKDTKEPIIFIYDLKDRVKESFKIRVKKGIKASFVEIFIGLENRVLKRELIVEEDAKLEYLKYQDIDNEAKLDLDYKLILKNSSKLLMTNLELGKGLSKNSFETNLDSENSNLKISGLVKLYKDANSSSIFITKHIAKNCSSDIRYKHALDDKTKALFDAKTIVEEEANFSKVLQNSNTLLLSDDAVIFARPHLEINIDELEASHGATTGSLNEEQLLYLCSRGIAKKVAYEMLLKAFENEIYDNIQDIKIKDFVKNFKRIDYV